MSVEVTETGLNLIPAGYKQTEVGVIPEDWDIRNIGDFAPLQRGFDLPSANRVNGKYPVVYSNGIVNTHCHFKVKGPGVVTGRSGTLGKVHYVEADYWPHNTSLWVTKFNETNPKFIYFIFTYINFERFASGSGVPTLNRNDAHSFKIAIPSSQQEQTAIANALSDVDTLISELEKLIAKKQAIKTATMQQLLTGRTRLPQFALREDGAPKGTKPSELGEIPEDWEVHSLGDLCNYQNGKAQEQYFNSNGGYKVVSIGNYSESGRYIDTGSYIDEKFKNEVGRFVLSHGDLAMILNDKTAIGTIIGRVLLIEADETYVMNQRTMKLAPKGSVKSKYLHFLLNSDSVHKRIVGMAKPGTQIYVNTDDVLGFNLLISNSQEEQTAIATILSDMDDEIQALEQRLGKTRQIKQGMMQELLTGKTRLPYDKE